MEKKKIGILAAAASAVVIIAVIIFVLSGSKQEVQADDLKAGLSYLEELENTDTSIVENQIKEIKKQERKAVLESGEIDVWQQFGDIVLMGDSRTIGFSNLELIESQRVIAQGGATIRDIPNYMDQLVNLNPSVVVFSYGLNDISIGHWDTVEEYISELDQRIEEVEGAVSNCTVFVNSIIPAIDPAFERSEKWRKIPDWNVSIKQHCEEQGIPYIEITDTVNEHADLYDGDGIHMHPDFYPFWAVDIITEVTDYE